MSKEPRQRLLGRSMFTPGDLGGGRAGRFEIRGGSVGVLDAIFSINANYKTTERTVLTHSDR